MKIALIGNQNSGKTTLFNLLTGMNAKIGNWPGVTIEKKTGYIKNTKYELIDLPGIYSLSPYSIEEEVAFEYIFKDNPDIIINIVDATSLQRSLYLTTQLMELDIKVIVALNMADILEKKGIKIDIDKLEDELGVKVVKISALKEIGIDTLVSCLTNDLNKINKYIYDSKIESSIDFVRNKIKGKHRRISSVKLIEKDNRFNHLITENIDRQINILEEKYDTDLEEVIATQRYKYIDNIYRRCVVRVPVKEEISDRLDKIFLNKWASFPIFVVIMFLVYYLSVGVVGSRAVETVGMIVDSISEVTSSYLKSVGASAMLTSLVVDGIIFGVGAVLGFIPELIILFLCISLLETTGYMSRIALLLDRLFRKIGLSGKSLIPFIVGSGCSVTGIMGTRIIENNDERELTTMLTPFIPCSAKLPIIALFSSFFFGKNSGIVAASLYFLAIVIIIVSALVFSKFVFKNTNDSYISELPLYKLPNFKYTFKDVCSKVIAFIERAGSIILFCSIIIWFLLSFSPSFEYGVDVKSSILATIGKSISWIFYPILGDNNWAATVSAIQGLVAKEQVVSSMAVISGFSEGVDSGSKLFANGTMFSTFTASSAYAFMVFNLFSAPCFGAIGAMRHEFGSTKKLLKVVVFQTVFAWILATICYQIGIIIETGSINVANIIIIIVLFGILLFIGVNKIKNKNEGCSSCPYHEVCK